MPKKPHTQPIPEPITVPDSYLFRQAVAGTRPLKATPARHPVKSDKPVAKPLREKKLEVEKIELEPPSGELQKLVTGENLSFLRPGLQNKTLRKLRRGFYRIDDELDLHGMTQNQAETILLEFIQHAQQQAFNCLKIIHGKGLGSQPARPVLKILCNHLLRRHPAVKAFVSARANDGGGGAVYVLLKIQSLSGRA